MAAGQGPSPFVLRLHGALQSAMGAFRYLDRYYRDWFDRVLRPPVVVVVQAIINARRPRETIGLAEERELPGEEQATRQIILDQGTFMRTTYATSVAERVGNTKTYGAVRGEFVVLDGLPEPLRQGVFAAPRVFPAWVRFGGPGPLSPPDMRDNGLLSVGVKLMGVEGPKLLDDERWTQDFTALSSPTFTTPDVIENVKLQRHLREGTPGFYFLDPRDSHLLDAIMQGLWARAQTSPLEARYWSTVPYLMGEGQAMQFQLVPRSLDRTPLAARPEPNYLRHAMARRLRVAPWEFDFRVQLQTDAHRMPIENASVIWPEKLSRPVTVARLVLPVQEFDSPEQLAFARSLSFQPWHCIAAHRPLGSQNRARKAIYYEMSKLRQELNGDPRIEPDGSETFPRAAGASR